MSPVDDIETFARCSSPGCGIFVYPPLDEPRCQAHGGKPEAQYAVDADGALLLVDLVSEPHVAWEVPA